jgi:hypothetical protein
VRTPCGACRGPTRGPTLSKASSSSGAACADRGPLRASSRRASHFILRSELPCGFECRPWWAALTVSTPVCRRCRPPSDVHPKMFTVLRHATGACSLRSNRSLAGLLSWGSSQRLPLHRHPTCVSSPSLLPSPPGEVSSGLDMWSIGLAPSSPPRLHCEPSAPECQSGTSSARAVSHDFGGLLHTRGAGLLHPAADHGVRLVAGSVSILHPHCPFGACTPCGVSVRAGQRPSSHAAGPKTVARRPWPEDHCMSRWRPTLLHPPVN